MVYKAKGETYYIRFAESGNTSDKEGFISLWNICFDDTPRFVEYFFSRRYFPEYSVCVYHGMNMVAGMQSMPVKLNIRGSTVNSAIVVGVCTHPDYRGQGLMRKMFEVYMSTAIEKGIYAVTYRPVDFNIYKSLGHLPSTRTAKINIDHPYSLLDFKKQSDQHDSGSIRLISKPVADLIPSEVADLAAFYKTQVNRYSGILLRDSAEFRLKLDDYDASSADISIVSNNGFVEGYCIFFSTPEEIYCEEFFAKETGTLAILLNSLSAVACGRKVKAKLPPDYVSLSHGSATIYDFLKTNSVILPQNVLGTFDVRAFLKQVNLSRFIEPDLASCIAIEVFDKFCGRNNGVMDLSGNPTKTAPIMVTDIGNLVQYICGYIRTSEFLENCGVKDEILSKYSKIMSSIGNVECFAVDEY